MTNEQAQSGDTLRVDKWLWFARFFKSRSLAAKLVQGRKVRLNSQVIAKPSVSVKPGDVLTFPQAKDIRVIKILELGTRRGPAPEAQMLYEDLALKETKPQRSETNDQSGKPGFEREKGSGRPTKADRRALDKLRQNPDN
ncbi:RNA-binding S4 domain-containing protein [Sneathiella sp. P13V-1]|uniref:RNA-binding S4 domain-containing protein n=1 Tax=Sneathiella sp. P13V-1 TaxID=2697366 RepID=UPI00187B6310|nr:RNA-binding S4 domain-containing protein [Sneathiella sp. P13V-1]MBE7638466.1 RNA-binding S4 domain-containing protein [Sneathiella sp. P13V-1]